MRYDSISCPLALKFFLRGWGNEFQSVVHNTEQLAVPTGYCWAEYPSFYSQGSGPPPPSSGGDGAWPCHWCCQCEERTLEWLPTTVGPIASTEYLLQQVIGKENQIAWYLQPGDMLTEPRLRMLSRLLSNFIEPHQQSLLRLPLVQCIYPACPANYSALLSSEPFVTAQKSLYLPMRRTNYPSGIKAHLVIHPQ